MAERPFKVLMKGVDEIEAALSEMVAATDAATYAAMRAASQVAKTQVKQGMRGRPRWDRRGASSRTGPEVNLNLSPHHVSKAGGPGKLTGYMRGAVGVVKKPKKLGTAYHGGIGVGGGRTPTTNLYKAKVNAKYPYLQPGVTKAEPKMAVAWKRAWAKATES